MVCDLLFQFAVWCFASSTGNLFAILIPKYFQNKHMEQQSLSQNRLQFQLAELQFFFQILWVDPLRQRASFTFPSHHTLHRRASLWHLKAPSRNPYAPAPILCHGHRWPPPPAPFNASSRRPGAIPGQMPRPACRPTRIQHTARASNVVLAKRVPGQDRSPSTNP